MVFQKTEQDAAPTLAVSRGTFVGLIKYSLTVAALLLVSFAASAATIQQPNFLVILMDDIGPEWFGCYGSECVETPQIDKLAASGVRFAHCYATPLCTTSRSVFLSGRYQFRTGWIWHSDPANYGGGYFDWERETTFARMLRGAGYKTAVVGKWQINNLFEQPYALDRHGFDEHCVWPGGRGEIPERASRYWDPYIVENGTGGQHIGEHGPDIYCGYLIDFMKRNRDKPFLAYYAMHLVHSPLVTTPHEPDPKSGADKRSESTAQYAAMVRYADHLIGRVLGALDELGLREKTVVLLTTDNGSTSGVDGRAWGLAIPGGKGKLTESGIDVPLIVSWPGQIARGVQRDDLVDFSDVFPTLLDFAGVALPTDRAIDGRSFAPLLLGKPYTPREWIFGQYADMRLVRGERYKLYSDGRFFDVEHDRLETTDLSGKEDADAMATRVELQAVLDSLPEDVPLPFEPRSQSYFGAKGRD